MKRKVICEGTDVIMFDYDKHYRTDEYEMFFNTKQGIEVLRGINGYKDPFVLDFPSLIDVGIMGYCPNNCKFCYQGATQQPHMTLNNFKRIINEVKQYTNQIALGGRGDPNLHPNFKEIVEYARSNGVVPNYTTSGNGLTKDHIESSKSCGAVAVSDYEQEYTTDAINGFLAAGIKTNIHFLLAKPSFSKAIAFLKGINPFLFDIRRINAVVFLLFKPQGRGKHLDWQLEDTQLEVFSEFLFDDYERPTKIGMDSCLVNKISTFTELPEFMKMSVDTCEAARMSMYITPDMYAMPCSFAAPRDRVSLQNTAIKDVWDNSSVFQDYRMILFNNKCSCPIFDGGIQSASIRI